MHESRVVSEAGDDTVDSTGKESDDSVPCGDSVALSDESMLNVLGVTKYTEGSRAWVLV